jgi:hypothetical protein
VGFADDLPKERGAEAVGAARRLGSTALRLTTRWAPGQTALDPGEAERLDRAVAASAGLRVFLSVYGTDAAAAPRDDAARGQYCAFVRDVLLRYPAVRDVVVWNEPNKLLFWSPQTAEAAAAPAPAAYEALLAHCYDVLHGAVPDVRVVGLGLSPIGHDNAGSTSVGAFVRLVGEAYRSSGRAQPLFDAVAHHAYAPDPAEPPWAQHGESLLVSQGDWNKLMRNLALAFDGTGQPLPGECEHDVCPVIWYAETGFQTAIDPAKAVAYTGTETAAVLPALARGGETDQRTQVLDAVRLAACQPYVAGILNFLLADEPRLEGWQSGALWTDGTEKPSASAFREAFAEASGGDVDCDALEGGRPSDDYEPPQAPRGLRAVAGDTSGVRVDWDPVDDPSAPVAFRVYRDGAHVATTETPSFADRAAAAVAGARYAVRALDAAGNLSAPSTEVVAVASG